MKSLIISLLIIGLFITGIYFGFEQLEKNNQIRKTPIPLNLKSSSLPQQVASTNKINMLQSKQTNFLSSRNNLTTNKTDLLVTLQKKPITNATQNINNKTSSPIVSISEKKKPASCNIEDLRLDREAKKKIKIAKATTLKSNTIKTNNTVAKTNKILTTPKNQDHSDFAIVVKLVTSVYEKPEIKTKQTLIFGTKLPLLTTTEKSTNFTKCLLGEKAVWLKNNCIEIIPEKYLISSLFKLPGTSSLAEAINITIRAFRYRNGNKLSKIIYKNISLDFKEKQEILIFSKADIKNITANTLLTYRKAGIPFYGKSLFNLKPKARHYKNIYKIKNRTTAIFLENKKRQFKFRKIKNRWFFAGIIIHQEYYSIY